MGYSLLALMGEPGNHALGDGKRNGEAAIPRLAIAREERFPALGAR